MVEVHVKGRRLRQAALATAFASYPLAREALGNRKQRRAASAGLRHRQHQQGDEIACSCGRRWPVGENHP